MSSKQIDLLCQEWLRANYSEEFASEYSTYSLVIPAWNSPELNDALEALQTEMTISFGFGQSFGATDYEEARERMGLAKAKTPVPDIFVSSFAGRK